MSGATLDVQTSPDGTLVIHPHGVLDADNTVQLRRTIVHAVRRVRPLRLVINLSDLQDLDAINLGALAAACDLGDDHQVKVFLDYCSPMIAQRLAAAGVPSHRLRQHVRAA
ncbi:STAS domain-containing protein [Micromonospora orduensis]|uniref:STAS domain-containing protein n=1 Tax=Micromonospora orduensis TaxID=1420891 RepID=A0A5C4QS30_9ACTN|nr:STAS domain-containing protein [Micromonospora orduensis]TNH28513.1 STAS domain-containing protein [Micromonospora orduensis]